MSFTVKIGLINSFTVELWGLREGLRLVKERGFKGIVVELGLEVVTDAINGDSGSMQGGSMFLVDCKTNNAF